MATVTSTARTVTNKDEMLNKLLDDVLDRHMQPEDRYEIAAILESLGWNDARGAEAFGVEDVFALASDLWERNKARVRYTSFAKTKSLTLMQLIVTLTRTFLRGMIFAIPMAVSVVSMLTLKFSLWSYENLHVELATVIAIGTILSFVTVGGFTQAIARRGFYYIIQGYYNMARRVTFHFIGLGFLVCVVMIVLIFLLNMVIQVFPYRLLTIIFLYFFFLNAIWLSVTVMYILKKELLFTGLILMGIGIVYILFRGLDINIIVSQLIALFFVSVTSIFIVIWLFKRAEAKADKGIQPQLPKLSVMVYSTMPYFIYGTLYFAFLYVDRIMAWSTNTKFTMPYLIWFRGEYELGLDFALLVLMVPMGVAEVILTKLMMDIEVSQKSYWGDETEKMSRIFRVEYYRRLAVIVTVSLVSAILLYVSLWYIFHNNNVAIGLTLFTNQITHFVFLVALASYVLLAIALMNAVILFSLSQPNLVLQSIWLPFAVNLVVGFLASRWMTYAFTDPQNPHGYEFAVLGLLAGSIVFVALSTRNVLKVLRNLDYYLYAAS